MHISRGIFWHIIPLCIIIPWWVWLIRWSSIQSRILRSSQRRCSVIKGALKNFANFTRKDLIFGGENCYGDQGSTLPETFLRGLKCNRECYRKCALTKLLQKRKDKGNQEFRKDNYPTQKMIQKNNNWKKKSDELSLPKWLMFCKKLRYCFHWCYWNCTMGLQKRNFWVWSVLPLTFGE